MHSGDFVFISVPLCTLRHVLSYWYIYIQSIVVAFKELFNFNWYISFSLLFLSPLPLSIITRFLYKNIIFTFPFTTRFFLYEHSLFSISPNILFFSFPFPLQSYSCISFSCPLPFLAFSSVDHIPRNTQCLSISPAAYTELSLALASLLWLPPHTLCTIHPHLMHTPLHLSTPFPSFTAPSLHPMFAFGC